MPQTVLDFIANIWEYRIWFLITARPPAAWTSRLGFLLMTTTPMTLINMSTRIISMIVNPWFSFKINPINPILISVNRSDIAQINYEESYWRIHSMCSLKFPMNFGCDTICIIALLFNLVRHCSNFSCFSFFIVWFCSAVRVVFFFIDMSYCELSWRN